MFINDKIIAHIVADYTDNFRFQHVVKKDGSPVTILDKNGLALLETAIVGKYNTSVDVSEAIALSNVSASINATTLGEKGDVYNSVIISFADDYKQYIPLSIAESIVFYEFESKYPAYHSHVNDSAIDFINSRIEAICTMARLNRNVDKELIHPRQHDFVSIKAIGSALNKIFQQEANAAFPQVKFRLTRQGSNEKLWELSLFADTLVRPGIFISLDMMKRVELLLVATGHLNKTDLKAQLNRYIELREENHRKIKEQREARNKETAPALATEEQIQKLANHFNATGTITVTDKVKAHEEVSEVTNPVAKEDHIEILDVPAVSEDNTAI